MNKPAADPPITATFRLSVGELELESFFAVRDSSTIFLCRSRSHVFGKIPQAILQESGAVMSVRSPAERVAKANIEILQASWSDAFPSSVRAGRMTSPLGGSTNGAFNASIDAESTGKGASASPE